MDHDRSQKLLNLLQSHGNLQFWSKIRMWKLKKKQKKNLQDMCADKFSHKGSGRSILHKILELEKG